MEKFDILNLVLIVETDIAEEELHKEWQLLFCFTIYGPALRSNGQMCGVINNVPHAGNPPTRLFKLHANEIHTDVGGYLGDSS